jgi:hypothetical protein
MKKTPTSFGLVSSITAGFTSGLLGGTGLLGGGASSIPSSDKAGLFLPIIDKLEIDLD